MTTNQINLELDLAVQLDVCTIANRDSLLKKMATVFEYDPYNANSYLVVADRKLSVPCHRLTVPRQRYDTAESLLEEMRKLECLFMTKLMGCKERLVRSTGWDVLLFEQPFCWVEALGVDSLTKPTVYTQHVDLLY